MEDKREFSDQRAGFPEVTMLGLSWKGMEMESEKEMCIAVWGIHRVTELNQGMKHKGNCPDCPIEGNGQLCLALWSQMLGL